MLWAGVAVADQRIRVLHVVKGLGPGGAERLLCVAAAERNRERFDYDVAYVLPWKDHLVAELTGDGVGVHCVGQGSGRARPVLDLRWVARLRALVTSGGYDVVHVHTPVIAGFVRPIVRLLGRRRPKLVFTEHNGWRTYALPTRLVNGVTYGLDDAHVAVSNEVRASIHRRFRDEVEVLVHGVRVDELRKQRAERAAVRSELGFSDDDVVIGTVANYLPQKAYPVLFEAARIAVAAEPSVRFVSVGQGHLEEEIKAEHARSGLGDRFQLLGYRADAVRILAGCDVFTLASHYEGMPVALMEALALGLPVAATAVGGVPDAVTEGREGLLVPPGRPGELADTYVRLAKDEMLRTQMAQAAYDRGADFDIRRAVRRMEDVYATLVGGAGSGNG